MYTCGGFILIFGKLIQFVKYKNKIKLKIYIIASKETIYKVLGTSRGHD